MRFSVEKYWNDYLSFFLSEQMDVYYREEYVKLYENDKLIGKCLVCQDKEKLLLMPFLEEKIGQYFDMETPYGYGGPILNTTDENWINHVLQEINGFLYRNKYICSFMRFHPLIHNEALYHNNLCVKYDRNTIAIDTSENEENIWKLQISSKNRNMIRKALKEGLQYKAEFDFASMDEFITLYKNTMIRIGADEFYFFDNQYFTSFKEKMKDKAFLGTVRKDGKLVCAALFMYSDKYGHYHLEGSNNEFSSLGGNNLLLWETACLFHKMHIDQFHLGGGTDSRVDNSLLKFKKAFSKNEYQFYIGKEIYNKEVYDSICNKWAIENPDKEEIYGNRLLKYKY